MHDTAKAIDALHSIPPDLPRDEWVKVGMGAHAAGVDFDTFDAWSAQAGNYDSRAARDVWRSIKPGKGVGAGTLYRMGRNTEPGLVVYLAAESPASVRGRLQAYQRHHGVRVPNFAIVQSPIDLFDGDADTEPAFRLAGLAGANGLQLQNTDGGGGFIGCLQ